MIEKLRSMTQDETLLSDPAIYRQVELLAELPSTAVIIWTSDGILLFTNEALNEFLHYGDDELKPGNKVERILVLPEAGVQALLFKEVSSMLAIHQDGSQEVVSLYTTRLSVTPSSPKKGTDNQPPEKQVLCSIMSKVEVDKLSPQCSHASITKENSPQNPLEASFSSRRSAAQLSNVSPPNLSPRNSGRPASPVFERRAQNVGDIVIVIDIEGKLTTLSQGARTLLENPPNDQGEVDADILLHQGEVKSLRIFLDADICDRLSSTEKRFQFNGVDGVEATLQYASRIPLPMGNLAVRFIPPPKKRGVSFMRKTLPDEAAGMLDILPYCVILVDKRARIEYWNPVAEKMFGKMQEEVHGQPLSIILPAPFHETHPSNLAASTIPRDILQTQRAVVARSFATEELLPLFIQIRLWQLTSEKVLYLTVCEPAPENSLVHQELLRAAVVRTDDHPLSLVKLEKEVCGENFVGF